MPVAEDEVRDAETAQWNERKLAQWDNIRPDVADGERRGLPLHLGRERSKTRFVLSWSDDNFEEAVVIGQLPVTVMVPKNPRKPVKKESDLREAAEHEKPRDKMRIDLSDDEIEQVLGAWSKGQSALTLPFVVSVFRHGKEYTR